MQTQLMFSTIWLVFIFLILLSIMQLGHYFPGMATRIEMIGVFTSFFLAPLFSAVSRIKMLVLVKVEVLVLVQMTLRHDYKIIISITWARTQIKVTRKQVNSCCKTRLFANCSTPHKNKMKRMRGVSADDTSSKTLWLITRYYQHQLKFVRCELRR